MKLLTSALMNIRITRAYLSNDPLLPYRVECWAPEWVLVGIPSKSFATHEAAQMEAKRLMQAYSHPVAIRRRRLLLEQGIVDFDEIDWQDESKVLIDVHPQIVDRFEPNTVEMSGPYNEDETFSLSFIGKEKLVRLKSAIGYGISVQTPNFQNFYILPPKVPSYHKDTDDSFTDIKLKIIANTKKDFETFGNELFTAVASELEKRADLTVY